MMIPQSFYIEQDPAHTAEVSPEDKAKRYRCAWLLCTGALNLTSWRMADRLARAWGCEGCAKLGVSKPNE